MRLPAHDCFSNHRIPKCSSRAEDKMFIKNHFSFTPFSKSEGVLGNHGDHYIKCKKISVCYGSWSRDNLPESFERWKMDGDMSRQFRRETFNYLHQCSDFVISLGFRPPSELPSRSRSLIHFEILDRRRRAQTLLPCRREVQPHFGAANERGQHQEAISARHPAFVHIRLNRQKQSPSSFY